MSDPVTPDPPKPPEPPPAPKAVDPPKPPPPPPKPTTAPAPAPKGPVVAPEPKAKHPYYVAHTTFHLPNGDRFVRGDVISGNDALTFEIACADGELNVNFASPSPHDMKPGS